MQSKTSSLSMGDPFKWKHIKHTMYVDLFGLNASRDWHKSIKNIPNDLFLAKAERNYTQVVYDELLNRCKELDEENQILKTEKENLLSHLTPFLDRGHYLSKFGKAKIQAKNNFSHTKIEDEDLKMGFDEFISKHVPKNELAALLSKASNLKHSEDIFSFKTEEECLIFKRVLTFCKMDIKLALYIFRNRHLNLGTIKSIVNSVLDFSATSIDHKPSKVKEFAAAKILAKKHSKNYIKNTVKHVKKFMRDNYKLSPSELCLMEFTYPCTYPLEKTQTLAFSIHKAYTELKARRKLEESLCIFLNFSLKLGLQALCELTFEDIDESDSILTFRHPILDELHEMLLDPTTLKVIQEYRYEIEVSNGELECEDESIQHKDLPWKTYIFSKDRVYFSKVYKSEFSTKKVDLKLTPTEVQQISERLSDDGCSKIKASNCLTNWGPS